MSSAASPPGKKVQFNKEVETRNIEGRKKNIELRGLSDIGEESERVRAVCTPYMPTERELEEHNVLHVRFRAWCKR